MRLEIRPTDLRTRVPITVQFIDGKAQGLRVIPKSAPGAETFDVTALGNVAQFSVSIPGVYEIVADETRETITVAPQRDLDFSSEFGIFSLAVLLLVGGMLVWLRKRAGSF